MVAKLIALCVALFLLGGTVQAANAHVDAAAATVTMLDLDTTQDDFVVKAEPVLAPPIDHGIAIEMPPITQLIAYAFAPRMDRPPRN